MRHSKLEKALGLTTMITAAIVTVAFEALIIAAATKQVPEHPAILAVAVLLFYFVVSTIYELIQYVKVVCR